MTRTLIRPAVLALTEYEESDEGIVLRAHRNESAVAAPRHVVAAVRALDGDALRAYPTELFRRFTGGLADRLNVRPAQLAIGNGADEILAAIGRAVLEPGDAMVTVNPTFGMYARVAAIAGAELRNVPYGRRWELDADALLARAQRGARLVVLGHPNNPTGDALDPETLLRVARALPQALIVVDEVYLSLGADSLVPIAATLTNVAVVGSLSKVAALAGMRVGYAVAGEPIASAVRRVMQPFPLSVASLAAADAYVRGGAETVAFEAALDAQTRRSLDAMVAEIGPLAGNVWRGLGNFVLMEFGPSTPAIAAALRSQGIAVRSFSEPELAECLRFCALNDASTAALITALRAAATRFAEEPARA